VCLLFLRLFLLRGNLGLLRCRFLLELRFRFCVGRKLVFLLFFFFALGLEVLSLLRRVVLFLFLLVLLLGYRLGSLGLGLGLFLRRRFRGVS